MFTRLQRGGPGIGDEPGAVAICGVGLTQSARRNDTVSLSYTRTFSNSVINELRGGFNRQRLRLSSNTTLEGFLSSIGFDDSDIAAWGAVTGAGELVTHGHAAVNFSNRFATLTTATATPTGPKIKSSRPLVTPLPGSPESTTSSSEPTGFATPAIDGFALNRGNPRGSVTYTGSGANPFADFLLGEPGANVNYVNIPRPPMNVTTGSRASSARMTGRSNSRLTLNLGLRYELITPFIDNNDLIANFDTATSILTLAPEAGSSFRPSVL